MKNISRLFYLLLVSSFIGANMGSIMLSPASAVASPDYAVSQTIPIDPSNIYWLDVDPLGQILVTDSSNRQVWIFDRNGQGIANITGFTSPYGVASTGDRIYVADLATDNISLIQNGVLTGTAPIFSPRGVTVAPDGTVYATSFGDSAVYVYNENLIQIDVITGVNGPEDVAVGPNGLVYVGSYSDDNVSIFSSDYTYLGSFGESGNGPGQFGSVMGIDVNPQGYIFVVDRSYGRVQIFSPDLQVVQIIPGFSTPYGVAADGTGRLYVSNQGTDNITILTTNDLGDHDGPVISDIQLNPLNPIGGQPINISASITDLSGIHNATLSYTVAGVTSTLGLSLINGSYTGVIAALPGGTTITFTIRAEDATLDHHVTISPTYSINVGNGNLILGIDDSFLAVGGLILGAIAVILGLISLQRKPKSKRKR